MPAVTPDAAFAAAMDAMSRPMAWGRSDCCIAACDAFAALHGADPMASLRGTYASRREAMRLIARHGGFVPLAEHMARLAGLSPCGAVPGAIGVAEDDQLVLCIGNGRWAGKGEDGVVIRMGWRRAWAWA